MVLIKRPTSTRVISGFNNFWIINLPISKYLRHIPSNKKSPCSTHTLFAVKTPIVQLSAIVQKDFLELCWCDLSL